MEKHVRKGFLLTTKLYKSAKIPLLWPLRSVIWKGIQKYTQKGRRSRIKNKEQTKNKRQKYFMQTSSTQSSDILEKTGCVQPRSNYTTSLRGHWIFSKTVLQQRASRNCYVKWRRSETSVPENDLHWHKLTKEAKIWGTNNWIIIQDSDTNQK